MPPIFHPSRNTVARVSTFGAALIVTAIVALLLRVVRSRYVTEVIVVREQLLRECVATGKSPQWRWLFRVLGADYNLPTVHFRWPPSP